MCSAIAYAEMVPGQWCKSIAVDVLGAGGQLEKVFKAAVGFLEEGSLDARTYGKRIIWQVKP